MNPLVERIDANAILDMQKVQFQEFLLMEDCVPANGQALGECEVSSLGDFVCQFLVGTFTCLQTPVAAIVDTGVNYLSGQLKDGNGMKNLFNARIPLNLFCSPGHRRDALSTALLTTDPVGGNLFYPIPFEYIFPSSSKIFLDCINTSNTDNYYEILFFGFRKVSEQVQYARGDV